MCLLVVLKGEEVDVEAVSVCPGHLEHILKLLMHFLQLIDCLLFHNWVMQLIQIFLSPLRRHVRQRRCLQVVIPKAILTFAHLMQEEEDDNQVRAVQTLIE